MTIGNRIKFLRDNLLQKEFADILGIPANSIYAWEANRRSLSFKHYLCFYQKLGVNLNWLLSGEGRIYVNNERHMDFLEYKLRSMDNRIKSLEIKISNMARIKKK